jgi:hypothetical protein
MVTGCSFTPSPGHPEHIEGRPTSFHNLSECGGFFRWGQGLLSEIEAGLGEEPNQAYHPRTGHR